MRSLWFIFVLVQVASLRDVFLLLLKLGGLRVVWHLTIPCDGNCDRTVKISIVARFATDMRLFYLATRENVANKSG